MADNVPITAGSGTTIATDEVGTDHYQKVKLVDGTADSSAAIPGDATNGLDVDVTRLPVLVTGDNTVGRVKLTDGTDVALVDGSGRLLVDASGVTVPVSGTLAVGDGTDTVDVITDGEDNLVNTTNQLAAAALLYGYDGSTWDRIANGGGTEAAALRVTLASDSTGVVSVDDNGGSLTVDAPLATPVNTQIGNATLVVGVIDETGAAAVDALAVGGGTAHDAVDSGNPLKVGGKARAAMPTAVTALDRVDASFDLYGRLLTAQMDPGMQVWKSINQTTTQTGSDVWSPTSGKRIAITYLAVSSYGTTAGRVILWFGANADTTYSAGTDQLIWAGSFAPSTTSKPGMILALPQPIFAVTADHEIHLTTDANLSIDITVYGYEF